MEAEVEMEKRVVDKVRCVISMIGDAKNFDEIILALYSLAVCLFPLRPCDVTGSVREQYRDEFRDSEIPSEDEKIQWRNIFYRGHSFRTFSKVLLYDIASNWLACFPASARKHVYDVFFLRGSVSEIVEVMVPCLQCTRSSCHDQLAVSTNVERLVELCFLENNMVYQIAKEIPGASEFEKWNHEHLKQNVGRLAQLVTSIPDKARPGASTSLSAHIFYKRISSQLLHALEDLDLMFVDESAARTGISISDATVFIGEIFARICRRGSADVLLSEVIPRILEHIRRIVIPDSDPDTKEIINSKPGLRIWLKAMEAVNDSHALQRIAEEALHQLVIQDADNVEGYWVLWVLFGRLYEHQMSVRSTFLEKFLLWKVFPLRYLRWIIQFSVLQCSPDCAASEYSTASTLTDTVQHLVFVWSRKEFVQSSTTEQQAYVTAALGLCLEKMSKQDLDATKDGLHLILQGVSCRLESPTHVIRKMATAIAFVFSKIIDPGNPLYLDDTDQKEAVDWEFGLSTGSSKRALTTVNHSKEKISEKDGLSVVHSGEEDMERQVGGTSKARMERTSNVMDPDEVIDPAELNTESRFDEYEGNNSDDSETSSSLQPYDLTDDDEDLKRKFTKLVDLIAAFQKTDDYDAIESALDVAEKLIRASPDELKYIAGDLVRTLVQVRCSDFTGEGEEDSAEEKREKALVALIVTCPLESLDCLNKILYTPNLDMSQRIMILDVMTEAAQELANSKTLKSERGAKLLISSVSSANSWFIPSEIGPHGAGPWKEVPSGNSLPWTYSWERELPLKATQSKKGKTRRWSHPTRNEMNPVSQNCFPQYAAAFMLPSMQGFDKKRQGVDLVSRDFIVLGKLIYMLAVCMKCAAMHPEASVLASPLLSMLRSREVCHHAEAYVRRSVLFAASCVLSALHPAYVASAVVEGNNEICEGLEWVRSYALQIADSETDRECHGLAMGCLQLHAEMALQASRAFESSEGNFITLSPTVSTSSRPIIIPYSTN